MAADEKSATRLQDEVFRLAEAVASSQVEARKVLIGFWEKLVIFDAAGLALSINAATVFRGHTSGDGGAGYLLAGWKWLLLSICLIALAQWVGSLSKQHLPLAAIAKLTNSRRARLKLMNADIFDEDLGSSLEVQGGLFRTERSLWLIAVVSGFTALCCAVRALYELAILGKSTFIPSYCTRNAGGTSFVPRPFLLFSTPPPRRSSPAACTRQHAQHSAKPPSGS